MKNLIKQTVKTLALCTCIIAPQIYAVVPVSTKAVTEAPLTHEIEVSGTLYGKNDVTLTSGVSGRLLYVVEPGTTVTKDEVLVRMDTLPLELDKARQTELLKRAKINLRLYQQELSRLKKLATTSSAAESQVDEVQNKHDLALSDIALAEVELRVIEDKLSRATIRAPFNGVISERFKRAGREINRADELVTILDIHHLEARLYVPVKYLKFLHQGIELPIQAGDLSHPEHTTATITAVIPSTDPRSQTVEVRASITAEQSHSWAIGQLVDVTVPLSSKQPTLLVDRDALILRKQGSHVVKIDAQNKAEQIPVTIGNGKGQWVEVIPRQAQSLRAGDKVAIRGAERLQTGQDVEVTNP
ncbi:efflux RND transporter periplasmic adaptor subunit [Pseudoalteromonas sp. J010]|uniref:efflux RND transporter periplasmic adaptor subunit n=1 Tax=Pseudoalteromonas sp. J010 TaxID=998465 RepID=UPI000F64D926|nr:efflux RND transporter periplasmic adaptor subunit [Pseudoalteromonas sp. J010]RRS08688.1 efflux RND transporter periplasmic adaptor subunit [Pseudoalteromonas sp. J010]